ncbi:MAG: hypothetical protein Q8R44_09180 [Novosphingobium sp.]|nr:hypothetical protein [Novosphingobium sp.]
MRTERDYLGQRYTVVGEFTRPRRDGTEATILTWASNCADCGEPFMLTTPAASSKFQPNRRCQRHKRPGHRVNVAT